VCLDGEEKMQRIELSGGSEALTRLLQGRLGLVSLETLSVCGKYLFALIYSSAAPGKQFNLSKLSTEVIRFIYKWVRPSASASPSLIGP
jgi:hypothetical protein